jgi:hypothetical protein
VSWVIGWWVCRLGMSRICMRGMGIGLMYVVLPLSDAWVTRFMLIESSRIMDQAIMWRSLVILLMLWRAMHVSPIVVSWLDLMLRPGIGHLSKSGRLGLWMTILIVSHISPLSSACFYSPTKLDSKLHPLSAIQPTTAMHNSGLGPTTTLKSSSPAFSTTTLESILSRRTSTRRPTPRRRTSVC